MDDFDGVWPICGDTILSCWFCEKIVHEENIHYVIIKSSHQMIPVGVTMPEDMICYKTVGVCSGCFEKENND